MTGIETTDSAIIEAKDRATEDADHGDDATGLSPDGVRLVAAAYGRAARFGQRDVGTEHLLFALVDHEPTVATKHVVPTMRSAGGLQALIRARGDDLWVHADHGADPATDAPASGARASMRESEWRARRPLPSRLWDADLCPSSALRGTVHRAIRHYDARAAGGPHAHRDGGAGSVHLALAVLEDPANRACEALIHRGVDLNASRAGLLALLEAPQPPGPVPDAVALLRDCGVLGGRGRLWTRLLVNGVLAYGSGPHSPVLSAIRQESVRQAVRCGREHVRPVDLLLAVLALDDGLTAHGCRLPADMLAQNTGAQALRAAGARLPVLARAATADPLHLTPATVRLSVDAERAVLGAQLRAAESGSARVGTSHLVAHLLEDQDGDPAHLLIATGVSPSAVIAALHEPPTR